MRRRPSRISVLQPKSLKSDFLFAENFSEVVRPGEPRSSGHLPQLRGIHLQREVLPHVLLRRVQGRGVLQGSLCLDPLRQVQREADFKVHWNVLLAE